MAKKRVLFICVHNSARSQMAEEYLRRIAGDRFEVESAGIEPGVVNPLIIEVMGEEGIDLSEKRTKSVFDLHGEGRKYDVVVTVCGKEAEEKCPVFPGAVTRLNWPFDDPSGFEGTHEGKLERAREVRELIREKIEAFAEVF